MKLETNNPKVELHSLSTGDTFLLKGVPYQVGITGLNFSTDPSNILVICLPTGVVTSLNEKTEVTKIELKLVEI